MDAIDRIIIIPKKDIIRPDYGQTSLKTWEPFYNEMIKKLVFIKKYYGNVALTTLNQIASPINSINNELDQLSKMDETTYVSRKQHVTNSIRNSFDEVKHLFPQFAVEAMESSGLLDYPNLKKEFKNAEKYLQELKDTALAEIVIKTNEIITNAEEKAKQIEGSARDTARKISVKDAQDQFRDAAKSNLTNIKIWGGITITLIVLFIIWVIWMLKLKVPPGNWSWQFGYESIIRIIIIGFIGTIFAFSLRILKSHLHMREHNLHRMRIANSMAAFAESANDKTQRDLILSRLVESVASFGCSGLIGNDDESNSKITIDNFTSALGNIKPGVS